MLTRRGFVLSSSAATLAHAGPSAAPVTVLYGDRTVRLEKARVDGSDLWVRSADLPRINEFVVKKQGACREDICIPLSKSLKNGEWFHLTGFARKLRQSCVADGGVWSFGEIPVLRASFYDSRIAPDFAVPDRKGRLVRATDFRGRKLLVVTWASW